MWLWLFLISLLAVGPPTWAYNGDGGGGGGGVKRPPQQQQQNQQQQVLGQARVREVFSWKQVDFVFPNQQARAQAIQSGAFVENNAMVPISVHASGNRVFLSMPRWKKGVPATLTWVPFPSQSKSPLLNPYPNWELNREGNCNGLASVFRVMADECNRLWVLDTGLVNSFEMGQQICPPKVMAFDLKTDRVIFNMNIPQNALKSDSLPVTIEVEYPNGKCGRPNDAVLYIADTVAFAIIVMDLATERAWRVVDKTVFPTPEAGTFNVGGETFELMDGVLGMVLGPRGDPRGRTLFFSAMSSFDQRWVKTSILRNQTAANSSPRAYNTGAQRRSSQSAGCGMDSNGVLFFGLVDSDALVCWNSKNPFEPKYIGEIAKSRRDLQFLATISVDRTQRLWAISTRFQSFFLNTLNPQDTNFRVFMSPSTSEAVKGTVCDGVGGYGVGGPSNLQSNNQLVFQP